jgi:autotransporter-associated beta strand protein
MKKTTCKSPPFLLRLITRDIAAALFSTLLFLVGQPAHAGSATWKENPSNGDWNTASNWTPETVPDGPSDVATFAVSTQTVVAVSYFVEVSSILYNPGASPFTISSIALHESLTIDGTGVGNNSGIEQNFLVGTTAPSDFGVITFNNSATAGSSTRFTLNGGQTAPASGGVMNFIALSTAGNGTFILNPGEGAAAANGGILQFFDSTTAANATFILNGVTFPGAYGCTLGFYESSTAAQATFSNTDGMIYLADSSSAGNGFFTNNGSTVSDTAGAQMVLTNSATAGTATIVANGGSNGGGGAMVVFSGDSTGEESRLQVFGNGDLDISAHNFPGVTIGSLEGDGTAFLGANRLIVGSNNLTTTFSGIIQDVPSGGVGGSLTKIGTGALTLSGANTFTGGTTLEAGTLLVTTTGASATGTGSIQVNAGTLGGTSKLSGAITIGTGSGTGAFLAPGISGTGRLTTRSRVALASDSTYLCELSTTKRRVDQISANGVTIQTGATFSFLALGNRALTSGTSFTVVNNTAPQPISGAFSNLADGSTFTVGPNTYVVDYEGGTGNDLTLTVQ